MFYPVNVKLEKRQQQVHKSHLHRIGYVITVNLYYLSYNQLKCYASETCGDQLRSTILTKFLMQCDQIVDLILAQFKFNMAESNQLPSEDVSGQQV